MKGLLAGGSAAGAALAAYAVRGRSSTIFGPSVYRGPSQRRAIALTFDDGPSPSTPRLLELLNRFEAKATFFECGIHVTRLPHISRQLLGSGHEIGNHTNTHPRLWLRSQQFIFAEIEAAQVAIRDETGYSPRLFRAPYGVRWPGVGRAQDRLGLLGVMWTLIALDWKLPAAQIARRVLQGARNGAIFCLHDGRGLQPNPDISPTIDALNLILPELKLRGYDLTTVTTLLRVQ